MNWENVESHIRGCIAICRKDNLVVFEIIESRNYYYADYYNNQILRSPKLFYSTAADMAKKKYNEDSLQNRLSVAKEFFLEDYRK